MRYSQEEATAIIRDRDAELGGSPAYKEKSKLVKKVKKDGWRFDPTTGGAIRKEELAERTAAEGEARSAELEARFEKKRQWEAEHKAKGDAAEAEIAGRRLEGDDYRLACKYASDLDFAAHRAGHKAASRAQIFKLASVMVLKNTTPQAYGFGIADTHAMLSTSNAAMHITIISRSTS